MCNPHYQKWYKKDHPPDREYHRQYHKKFYEENIDYMKVKSTKWRLSNPEKRRANEALRRARKLHATPKWLTKDQLKEIKTIYLKCPKGYHVDHIHPLKGTGLCGLHVPWNLQYLPAKENLIKYNRL